MMESRWRATHINKSSGIYVRVVELTSVEVIIERIEGATKRVSSADFAASYRDLDTVKGYFHAVTDEEEIHHSFGAPEGKRKQGRRSKKEGKDIGKPVKRRPKRQPQRDKGGPWAFA